MDFLERVQMLIGIDKINLLNNKKIIVFGCGGVGSAAIEALARAGVGNIDFVDGDVVSVSNINRQLIALHSTIGENKVDVVKKRLLDINPSGNFNGINLFYSKETFHLIDLKKYDFVVDCIDNVTAKLYIIEECSRNNINLIVSTGTGNRLDPTQFYITDIFKTTYDPLARILRIELKKRGIKKLTVLASREIPVQIPEENKKKDPITNKNIPASISFVPPVAGYIIASFVINKLIK